LKVTYFEFIVAEEKRPAQ